MTVLNLPDGRVRDDGEVRYTVELLGRQQIRTQTGQYDAYVLAMKRQIQLLSASSTVSIRAAYAPGKGLVAEHVVRDVKIPGIINLRQEHWRRRTS